MASLFVVATPIGNLKDITLRALETLSSVSFIACEDTRHSSKLLSAHGISKPLISCFARKESAGAAKVVDRLNGGEDGAYISDAGTPGVSDPGAILVRTVRDSGHEVVPIPGAAAVTSLFSVNGFKGKGFIFEGYLSPKAGRRRTRLKELLAMEKPVILYESPYRIINLLRDIADIHPEGRVLIGREMTKLHEEIIESTALEAAEMLESRGSVKGEFAVLVSLAKKV